MLEVRLNKFNSKFVKNFEKVWVHLNKLVITGGVYTNKVCKGERLLLGEIYSLIEENEVKLFCTPWHHISMLQYLYLKMLHYIEITMRHHYLYVNSPKDIFPQQYGHDHLIEND